MNEFHPFHGVVGPDPISANMREFVGDGSPYLPVPGLSDVHSVIVQGHNMPLQIEREYPLDPAGRRLETKKHDMVKLVLANDGTPVLMRSIYSNDGVWQKGHKVLVGGKWDDAPKADVSTKPVADLSSANDNLPPTLNLSSLTKAQLLQIAQAEGASAAQGATNAEIIAAIEVNREAMRSWAVGSSS